LEESAAYASLKTFLVHMVVVVSIGRPHDNTSAEAAPQRCILLWCAVTNISFRVHGPVENSPPSIAMPASPVNRGSK